MGAGKRLLVVAAVAVQLAALPLAAQDDLPVQISGRTVNEKGQPVEGVRIGVWWTFMGDKPATPWPNAGRPSGKNGEFSLTFEYWREKFRLVAFSRDFKLAGISTFKRAAKIEDVVIRMKPSVTVKGRVRAPAMTRLPWFNFQVQPVLDTAPFLQIMPGRKTTDNSFSLPAPSGFFRWHLYGNSIKPRNGLLMLPPTRCERDLGEIKVKPTFLARHEGKRLPPWRVTETRGLAKGKDQIVDFKGKWVLVEFWGFW